MFTGALSPVAPLSLNALVFNLLGVTPPTGLPQLSIEQMQITFSTGQEQEYQVLGAVSVRWNPDIFGSTIKISVTAWADVRKSATLNQLQGQLGGSFSINRLMLSIAQDIGVTNPSYVFKAQIDTLWLTAVVSWKDDGKGNKSQILTAQLGGMTLGGMLEYLVNLAAPTIGFQLDPPWDALNHIDLSRFQLVYDITNKVVSFTNTVDVNLVVMQITSIGVRYDRKNGTGAVNLILDGTFLGQDYSGDDALAWDVISDSPPTVPGQNDTLVDLRYIGLGQHVTLQNIDSLFTVKQVLDALSTAMRPPENPNQNPLSQPTSSGLVFAADSEWLIGLDIGLMETVDLGIIFNDPRLYGLYIALSGEKAGSTAAGLYFEILYKKITGSIGMFRIELQLPETFRHIEMGEEVSITLGIVVVEIYTNGNFKVDLGFPYQRDFSRSFTVQVFPFIGRGGIYFGVLNGDTSQQVPRITNGTFSPVIELGVGLSVGVGKEISVGPLSGGAYVEVEIIFMGVLSAGSTRPITACLPPSITRSRV